MKQEFSKKQTEVLEEVGLSKAQALLYLTSLKYGPLSVLNLSKKTGVNRQQIYDDAEKLVDMGLYEPTSTQRRKYVAARPAKLLGVGEKKISEIEKHLARLSPLLPDLESLSSSKKNRVVVRYYEGHKKIEDAYEQELDVARDTEVLSFAGSIDDIFEFFPESYWENWNKKFVKHGSHSRMLVHDSSIARAHAKHDERYNRQTRKIGNFPLKVNIDVFNNVVLIVSFYDETALWIESHTLAHSYRILFNALWAQAQPF